MSNLLRCFGFTENRLHLGQTQTYRFGSALGLHCFSRLELSHVPKYAPSFSLSAPCILLTLTRRLRFISNSYFDTPSFLLHLQSLLPPTESRTQSHANTPASRQQDFGCLNAIFPKAPDHYNLRPLHSQRHK